MASNDDQLLQTIERIYDAAADPTHWQIVLDNICGAYGGGRGTLLQHDLENGTGVFAITASWEDGWVEAYNAHYGACNPWLANLKKRPLGRAVQAEFMLDRPDLIKTEFFSDFLRPQNLLSGVGVTLFQDQSRFVALSVLYPELTALEERQNVAYLQRLAPHLRRAMQVNRQMAAADIKWQSAEVSLNKLKIGFVLASASGRATFHNTAANRIFSAKDGLSLDRDGSLSAASTDETARLRKAISGAARILRSSDVASDRDTTSGSLSIGRPSGKRSYAVLVTPLNVVGSPLYRGDTNVAVLIADRDLLDLPLPDELAAVFGITKSEARLLRELIKGSSLAEASKAMDISLHTTRTHLRSIFGKMDCSRQSDVIRTVMDHPIWLIDRQR